MAPPNLKAIENTVSKLLKKISDLEEENTALRKSIEFCSDSFNNWKKEIDEIKKLKDQLSTMIPAESSKASRIQDEVQRAMESDHQHSRLNNLKITGVPEKENENLYTTVINISKAIGEPLELNEIDIVHRVPSYSKSMPKPIIVRFVNRWKKENILFKLRSQKKRTTTTDAGDEGRERPIFINEHLAQSGETLAKKARDLKRSKKVLHTWVRNARVYIRKTEDGPARCVTALLDLEAFE